MSTLVTLQIALLGITGVLVTLGAAIAVRRVVRTVTTNRWEQRTSKLRPQLLRILSEDEPDLSPLDELVRKESKLVEALVWQLLSKVRGSSRLALTAWLEAHGAVERARKRTHRPGTVGRGVAAERLGDAGIASTSADVSHMLDDRRLELRIVAARALGKLGDPRAVPRLLDALDGPRAVPQSLVLMALIHIGPTAVDPLIDGLGRKSPGARAVCAQLLGVHGAIQADKWLVAVAQYDTSTEVRVEAAASLGRLGMPKAVNLLIRLLAPENPSALRTAAAISLGQIGGQGALSALQSSLGDNDMNVARASAEALTKLGESGADVLALAVETGGVASLRAEEWLARSMVEDQTRRHRKQRNVARRRGAST